MPRRHQVERSDINLKRLGAVLAVAHDAEIHTFADALLMPGMGPRALQSLALVSEVIHGTPSRFSDPARFSFAHGGKDRRPFPVPTKIYDRTIEVLGAALRQAKLGDTERVNGFKRLHAFTRMVEDTFDPCADLEQNHCKGMRRFCGSWWEEYLRVGEASDAIDAVEHIDASSASGCFSSACPSGNESINVLVPPRRGCSCSASPFVGPSLGEGRI